MWEHHNTTIVTEFLEGNARPSSPEAADIYLFIFSIKNKRNSNLSVPSGKGCRPCKARCPATNQPIGQSHKGFWISLGHDECDCTLALCRVCFSAPAHLTQISVLTRKVSSFELALLLSQHRQTVITITNRTPLYPLFIQLFYHLAFETLGTGVEEFKAPFESLISF